MPYFTEDQIRQARNIDLLTYLQTYEPTELVRINGNTWCTREHDSLKISSNGKWMWWSRRFGGASALDYLIKVKGMTFTQAMQTLADDTFITESMFFGLSLRQFFFFCSGMRRKAEESNKAKKGDSRNKKNFASKIKNEAGYACLGYII